MGKKKKLSNPKEMVQYTYRDSGQEYIMKRKMVRAIIIAIIFAIALIVFIALYIDASNKVQQTYRRQYKTCLELVLEDLNFYENAEGDFDFKYNKITADMNSVSSFAFLIDNFEEEQKAINELYTVFLKYPQQMKTKISDAKQAIEDIIAGLDKGYDEARDIVDSINKKGY